MGEAQPWWESRTIAALAHASFFFATLIFSLALVILSARHRNSAVYKAAAQAFNWQLAWVAAEACLALANANSGGLLQLLSFIAAVVVLVAGISASLRATSNTARGSLAHYPFRLRVIPSRP